MSNEKVVDADAIIWLIESGGTVTNETIVAMANELKAYKTGSNRLYREGCGYRECGLSYSGFSGDEDNFESWKKEEEARRAKAKAYLDSLKT